MGDDEVEHYRGMYDAPNVADVRQLTPLLFGQLQRRLNRDRATKTIYI